MSERSPTQRITLHATEEHFFIAANPPFNQKSTIYDQLDFMSTEVRDFDDGSQVFVCRREGFGDDAPKQERELVAFTHTTINGIDGVILDPTIHPVGAKD
jgi:hypothetical protein